MNKIDVLNPQFTHKVFMIQGVKVRAVFPKANKGSDVMDTIRDMLVHSYINTYDSPSKPNKAERTMTA